MSDFIFRISPNVVLGSYTLSRLGQQVKEWGTRFMLIIDPVLNEMKIQENVVQSLNDRKIDIFIFNEITEGANTKTIQRALSLAKEGHVHGIIAVGGTKALNVGRLVAAFYNEIHDFYTFVDGAFPTTAPIPCICVPTTYKMPYIFTNEVPVTDSRFKQLKIMKVQHNLCKLALIDPNLTLSLTENQKSSLAIDLMNEGVEAYLSQKANFFSDMFVEKGLELLAYALDGSPTLEITTPEEVLLSQAGTMISLASASSSLGLSSMLSMTINSRYNLNKALISSIIFPYAVEDALTFKSARLEKLAHIMRIVPEDVKGQDASKALVDNIRQRIAKANLPARLKDVKLTIEQLSLAVDDVSQNDIVNKLPRSMSTDDIFDFIKQAY